MKKFKLIIIVLVFVVALFVGPKMISAVMTSTGGYEIWADVISMGGAEDALSASDDFQLRDTLGEPIISRSSTTVSDMRAGFREMERGSLTLSITPSSLDLGDLDNSSTASATATLSFFSDTASSSVLFSGFSLYNGVGYIQGIGATAVSSIPGTSQFGFNAIFSQGDAYAYALSPYNQVGKYALANETEVVENGSPMLEDAEFTLNYIANISGAEQTGDYSASLLFTALGSF
jgi:hypothetical protein